MKPNATITALLGASLLLCAAAPGQRTRLTGRQPARQPTAASTGQTALLVLLENGGVKSNFAECKVGARKVRLPAIPVARCGSLCLALNPGENVAQMLLRAADVINRNRSCTNPARWRVETMTFDQWFKLSSDFMLEELTKAIAQLQNTRGKYGKVEVLEDAAFKPGTVLAKMTQLARSGYTLDIHVLAHGGSEAFYGGAGARFDESTFFAAARRIAGLKLRSVYQMNCVSGTLMDDWIRLGAKVVNGTYGTKNNYMPQSYFHFTAKWLGGETFSAAVLGAYAESRFYTEPVYNLLGLRGYVTDSRHRIQGDGRCQLMPMNPIAKVTKAVVAQTTATLCAGFRTAKKTAEQACRLLVAAGCKIEEIAAELQRQYSCSPADIARFMKAAGCKAADIARCLVTTLKCKAADVARFMIRAGFSCDVVAQQLKDQARCSLASATKHLHAAGCSARQIARCLKARFKCSAKTIAKHLRGAGCKVSTVASALDKELRCSTRQLAACLEAAGCSFEQTAKAVWNCGKKNAGALQSLVDAMVATFKQNIAQVSAGLAKLGIRA
jgi:hypothetical protein